MSVAEALSVLFAERHQLPADAIRSLECITFCASAARWGEPEGGGIYEPADYAEHDTAACEAENAAGGSE